MLTNRRVVLHVDDDPALTQQVAALLAPHGLQVEAVNDPLDAMDAVIERQHRVVLLDIDMPHKSGMHLLSEIKAHDAGIQVVMLTGLVGVSTVLETMHAGAEACLFKPVVEPSMLVSAIEDAFRRSDRWWGTLRELTKRRREEQSAGAVEDQWPAAELAEIAASGI